MTGALFNWNGLQRLVRFISALISQSSIKKSKNVQENVRTMEFVQMVSANAERDTLDLIVSTRVRRGPTFYTISWCS